MSRDSTAEIAARFKAVGDPTRLRILGLLARRPRHGEELATALDVSASTVSHHMKLLRQAGMVSVTRENPYVLFKLRPETLHTLGSLLENPYDLPAALGLAAEDASDPDSLSAWLDDHGRLRELPSNRSQFKMVLRWVAGQLDRARFYAESELRLTLNALAHEPDDLREALVEAGFLRRSGNVYRRTEDEVTP